MSLDVFAHCLWGISVDDIMDSDKYSKLISDIDARRAERFDEEMDDERGLTNDDMASFLAFVHEHSHIVVPPSAVLFIPWDDADGEIGRSQYDPSSLVVVGYGLFNVPYLLEAFQKGEINNDFFLKAQTISWVTAG